MEGGGGEETRGGEGVNVSLIRRPLVTGDRRLSSHLELNSRALWRHISRSSCICGTDVHMHGQSS